MENQDSEPAKYDTLCSECKAGAMHLQYITYFTWLDQELILVPNFPAWVCDMCGRREYDARAINWLNTLLSPATGRKPASQRRSGTTGVHRPLP